MSALYPNLTAEAVANMVRTIASERPDFVYTDQPERNDAPVEVDETPCSYLGAYTDRNYYSGDGSMTLDDYKGEGCIVGQALVRLGVKRSDLIKLEGMSAREAVQHLSHRAAQYRDNSARFIMAVQGQQDDGASWSEAVKRADTLNGGL